MRCGFNRVKILPKVVEKRGLIMDTYPDMVSFSILKNARQAKDLAYKALKKAKDGELEEARRLLSISDAACSVAQQAESELLTFDMTGREHVREHSRDHLMSSILATELVHEMVEKYHSEND